MISRERALRAALYLMPRRWRSAHDSAFFSPAEIAAAAERADGAVEVAAALGTPLLYDRALHALAEALSFLVRADRDEVILPGLTCPDLAAAVEAAGGRAVAVDLAPDGALSPDGVAAAVGPRTAAVVAAALWGRSGLSAEVVAAAGGVPVVDDRAQRLHASPPPGPAAAIVWSFAHGKNGLATAGGAVRATDPELLCGLAANFACREEETAAAFRARARWLGLARRRRRGLYLPSVAVETLMRRRRRVPSAALLAAARRIAAGDAALAADGLRRIDALLAERAALVEAAREAAEAAGGAATVWSDGGGLFCGLAFRAEGARADARRRRDAARTALLRATVEPLPPWAPLPRLAPSVRAAGALDVSEDLSARLLLVPAPIGTPPEDVRRAAEIVARACAGS